MIGVVGACLSLCGSHATAVAEENQSPVVTIGSDTSLPGGVVLIPLALKLPERMEVVSLSLEIQVQKSLLKLKAVRPSLATEMAKATVTSELKDLVSPGAEGSRGSADLNDVAMLVVKIVGKNPLPSGTVATLDLRIADEVGDTSSIGLNPENVALATADGRAVPGVQAKAGDIKISKSPPTFVNCFFFSH